MEGGKSDSHNTNRVRLLLNNYITTDHEICSLPSRQQIRRGEGVDPVSLSRSTIEKTHRRQDVGLSL
jgi:hypothetical protein